MDSLVGEFKNQKRVVNFEQVGCIFHLYGEQKPMCGLSPNIFWWYALTTESRRSYLVMIGLGVFGWL